MAFVFLFSALFKINAVELSGNLLGEFNLLFKEKTHLKIVYACLIIYTF